MTGRGCALRAVILLAVALPAPGSSLAAAPAPVAISVVRFTAFSARPLTDVAFVPRAGTAPQPVQFFPTARSPRYEYHGTMPLRFVAVETRETIAEVTIPAGMQNALLLFSPLAAGATGAGKLRYQVAVLDDGAARHGPGGLAIINLSGLTLGGSINDRALTLKSGLNPTLPVGRAAKIRLTTVVKQRTYQAYAGTATLGRDERALLILFPPAYRGAFEVQARLLVDRAPPAGGAGPK